MTEIVPSQLIKSRALNPAIHDWLPAIFREGYAYSRGGSLSGISLRMTNVFVHDGSKLIFVTRPPNAMVP